MSVSESRKALSTQNSMPIQKPRPRKQILEEILSRVLQDNMCRQLDPSALTALQSLLPNPKEKHLHAILTPLEPFLRDGCFRLSAGRFTELAYGLQQHIAHSVSMLTNAQFNDVEEDLKSNLSYGQGGFVFMMRSSIPSSRVPRDAPGSRAPDEHNNEQCDPSLIAALAIMSFPPSTNSRGISGEVETETPFLYELRTFVAPHTGIGTRLAMSVGLLCRISYGGMVAICSRFPSLHSGQLREYYGKYLYLYEAQQPYDFSHNIENKCITKTIDDLQEIILKSRWSLLYDPYTFFPLSDSKIDFVLATKSVCGLYRLEGASLGRAVRSQSHESSIRKKDMEINSWLDFHLQRVTNGSKVAVITLLGSLCPVTVAHISMFEQARRMILSQGGKYEHVLGFVSLNTDYHVKTKLSEEMITPLNLFQRKHLVQLAVGDDTPWLHVEETSGHGFDLAKKRFKDLRFKRFFMNGADDFLKYTKWKENMFYAETIIVGRAEHTARLYDLDVSLDELSKKGFSFCFIAEDDAYLYVSSSKVRSLLQAGEQMKAREMLHERVFTYLNLYGPWQPWLGLYRFVANESL